MNRSSENVAKDHAPSRPAVCRIGGSEANLAWKDALSSSALTTYDVIFCEPDRLEEAEIAAVRHLRDLVAVDRRWRGRVVWTINEHFTSNLGKEIGCGEVVHLPLPPGRVLSMVRPGDGVQPVKVLRDPPDDWRAIAKWRSNDGKSEVLVGAISHDTRFVVVPPGFSAEAFVLPYERIQRLLPFAWVLLLALTGFLLVQHEYARTEKLFKNASARIGGVKEEEFEAPPRHDAPADATPAGRLVDWLLGQPRVFVTSISPEIRLTATPFQLWKKSTHEQRSTAYFDLSLASGDLASAYRIAKASIEEKNDATNWPRLLTSTLWQRAVASLYELDLESAEIYTGMYVDLTNVYAVVAEDDLGPQRNRTLAHILLDELHSPRAESLCVDPEAARAFGRLLGGNWGRPLPANLEGLRERREENRRSACPNGTFIQPTVDYGELAMLETIDADTDISTVDLCSVLEVECGFLQHRAALLRYERELLTDVLRARSPVNAALQFSSDCTYLSDDLLDIVFAISRPETRRRGLRIDDAALDRALACVEPTSDYATLLKRAVGGLPCDAFVFHSGGRMASELGQKLVKRCVS